MIGASAGGVPALETLVSSFPPDLPAAALVVMHLPAWRRSELPYILGRKTRLPVSNPSPQQLIQNGQIYVAPPDYHLVVERNCTLALWHGPKENNFRPAINPLFRSAADVYGDRVIGVILTGTLDEGIAGLAWIKRHGGLAVVQDPKEAAFPSMPQSALDHVPVDYVAGISALGPLLVKLINAETADLPLPVKGGS